MLPRRCSPSPSPIDSTSELRAHTELHCQPTPVNPSQDKLPTGQCLIRKLAVIIRAVATRTLHRVRRHSSSRLPENSPSTFPDHFTPRKLVESEQLPAASESEKTVVAAVHSEETSQSSACATPPRRGCTPQLSRDAAHAPHRTAKPCRRRR